MALIKCKECGKEISDQAESCPNCGYKIIQTRTKKSNNSSKSKTGSIVCLIGAIIYLLLIIIPFIMLTMYATESTEKDNEKIVITPKYDFLNEDIKLSPETQKEKEERENEEQKDQIETQRVIKIWEKCVISSSIISGAIIILSILIYGLIMLILSIILMVLSGLVSYCIFFIIIFAPICCIVGSIIIITDREIGKKENEIKTTN